MIAAALALALCAGPQEWDLGWIAAPYPVETVAIRESLEPLDAVEVYVAMPFWQSYDIQTSGPGWVMFSGRFEITFDLPGEPVVLDYVSAWTGMLPAGNYSLTWLGVLTGTVLVTDADALAALEGAGAEYVPVVVQSWSSIVGHNVSGVVYHTAAAAPSGTVTLNPD